jgi:DNA-binding CsgD family transcriptional regulator
MLNPPLRPASICFVKRLLERPTSESKLDLMVSCLYHAAGLLAMQCMVRGQRPSDYLIVVPAAPENLCDLSAKAQKLLEAGHSVKANVRLTRREEEVLDGIFRGVANKEIASELNITERTVKFHISSLLSKFKVHSRMELMREASQQAMKLRPAPVGSPASIMIRGFAPESEVPGEFRRDSLSGAPTLDGLIGENFQH